MSDNSVKKSELKRKHSSENKGLVTGATIAMIILIAVLILVSRPTVVNPGELAKEQIGNNNILVQLKNNYSLYKMGKYDNQMVSGNKEYLRSYLSSEGFKSEPFFIDYDDWNIAYFFTTESEREITANYLFKRNDNNYLYVYQVPLYLLQDKKIFNLSDKLLKFLESGQCFSLRKENLVYLLKKSGENILGFVVNIKNKDLIIELCAH
jgi:hypothetical protein